jgi:hypothetical protein
VVASRRDFPTGAWRNPEDGKLDYEAFLNPAVLQRFAQYMDSQQGEGREADNWQLGIPVEAYMKSLYRHFMDVWLIHRGYEAPTGAGQAEALCAVLFNAMGMLLEVLKAEEQGGAGAAEPEAEPTYWRTDSTGTRICKNCGYYFNGHVREGTISDGGVRYRCPI